MSNSKPKIAVYGDSREAFDLRALLSAHELLGQGERASLHVIAPHPFETALPEVPDPKVYLRRASWHAGPLDNWLWVDDAQGAADWLQAHQPGPALIAVGYERLAPFYQLKDQVLLIRSRKIPHPAKPNKGDIWTVSGPFTVAQEVETLRANGVAAIIAHDAGGAGGWPKLAAARQLGLPVVLLKRKAWPNGPLFDSVEGLARYINSTLGLDLGANGA